MRVDHFDCGAPELNDWLSRRARTEDSRWARTYAASDANGAVGAYYCLFAGGVTRAEVPRLAARAAPDPVPVVVLGRLAVDLRFAGRGIGGLLLRDAMVRVLAAADRIGALALLVHAIGDDAARFYARYGFRPAPFAGGRTLFIAIETIRGAVG
jgi:GNAT superfamily N-acetyltransferase